MNWPFLKKLEHAFKRFFFLVSAVFLKKGRKEFSIIDPLSINKVLFIRPEKLGDMVISLPVFHNLKKLYPHLELYTISSPRNIAIVANDERISKNFLYTKNFWHDIKTIRDVRRLNVDAVVDMVCDDSVTALILTQLSSSQAWRIGLGKTLHKKYYDFNYLYRTNDDAHILDNTLRLLTAFGIDSNILEHYVSPTLPEQFLKTADNFLESLNGTSPDGILGLNLSAGRPTRVWQNERNETLINMLLENYPGHRIVITADPKEQKKAVDLAGKFNRRVTSIPPGLNLLEVSAIISQMKLLITPDTSLVHIARSFKVPVVGLYTRFGHNFKLWKPYNQKGGAVISGNDYNIHDIEVNQVFTAVLRLLPPKPL